MQVNLDPDIKLVSNYAQFTKRVIGECCAGVWRERSTDQRMVGKAVVNEIRCFADVFAHIACPRSREFHDWGADIGPHMRVIDRFGHDFREKVLVTKAGGAATQHLGDGEFRAIANHFGADPALFYRPDALGEPARKWQIVADAAKKRHCRVRMRIHEAGQQGVIRAFDGDAGLVFLQRFGAWQDVDNAAVVEHSIRTYGMIAPQF